MTSKKVMSIILKAPLVILVIIAFIASIYAAFKNIANITYASPIILGIIILLYFIGVFLNRKKDLY